MCPRVSKAFTTLEARHQRCLAAAKGSLSPAGFSLIELTIAILVLTIVIAGGSYLFVGGRSRINQQKHYRAATLLAAQKLEELKAEAADNYDNIVSKADQPKVLEGVSYNISTGVVDVGLYKNVIVTVNWQQTGTVYNVSLITFIAPKAG